MDYSVINGEAEYKEFVEGGSLFSPPPPIIHHQNNLPRRRY